MIFTPNQVKLCDQTAFSTLLVPPEDKVKGRELGTRHLGEETSLGLLHHSHSLSAGNICSKLKALLPQNEVFYNFYLFKKNSFGFICCQLMRRIFTASQHGSYKYVHSPRINNMSSFCCGDNIRFEYKWNIFYHTVICNLKITAQFPSFIYLFLSLTCPAPAKWLHFSSVIATLSTRSLFGVCWDVHALGRVALIANKMLTQAGDVFINWANPPTHTLTHTYE